MRATLVVSLSMFLTSCASNSGTALEPVAPRASAADCARQLAPRAASRAAMLAEPSTGARPEPSRARPSRLVVHARLQLSKLAAELERHVKPRLAQAQGVKIGPAGVLDYSVDRGAFSLSIAGDQLVLETPLHGRAEACRRGRCYASCEPRAQARVEIPLWLSANYGFDRSRVSLSFTKGCKVRALRGMLNVEVTSLLKSALAPQLERVRREIDARLPDVRARVERGWRQLARPRPLPIGGCLVLEPLGFVQGPVQQSGQMAHARFALLARPELRSECDERAALPPLPPLSAERSLPDEDVVRLGMELPLEGLARAFEASSIERGAEPRQHVAHAKVEAAGQRIAAELELTGELCGSLALQATPILAGEEGLIGLGGGKLDIGEAERVRSVGLDPDALARELMRQPRLSPPLSLATLRAAPSAVSWLFSDPAFVLDARVSSVVPAGAAVRGEHVVTWVEARGSLWLEQK